ncbi:uncharacterized protein LOC110025418 [Phalaenopsis equestris]|uniref:uncharacterized protein LOC110025418 n=1 Tax=Phalaenopsis equestris TaxID=78828 RepID=UPI0009E62D42|nr:uncharacterized protein LOC110025418 [Phalaenopsis equestris]
MERSKMKQEKASRKVEPSSEKKKRSPCSCFFVLLDLLSSCYHSRSNFHQQSHINPEPTSPRSIIINQSPPAPAENFTLSSSPAPISPCISYSPRTLDRLLCTRFSASDHLSYSSFSLSLPPAEALPNRDETTKPETGTCRRLAVAKWSCDREEDFRDSMKKMISENGTRRSEDLQDLLAGDLSLNAKDNHGAIVNAFNQVSFELLNNDRCIEASY